MRNLINIILSSFILAWLSYLLVSFVLIESLVSYRNIDVSIDLKSESNQVVRFSYNLPPFQAGAISFKKELKKGDNIIDIPFNNDLEITRIYVVAESPINFTITAFKLNNAANLVEVPISLIAKHSSVFANGGQEVIHLEESESALKVELTKKFSSLVISNVVLESIYDQLTSRYHIIALISAIISFIFTIVFLYKYKSVSAVQLYSFIFLAIIFTPFLSQKDNHTSENRILEPFPNLDVNIWTIPNKFNKYYNDHFPYRNGLRNIGNAIKYHFFNTSPKPNIVQVGKEGWLFYSTKEVRSVYQGIHLFTNSQLETIRLKLETKARLLATHGITYYLIIPPLKHQIYSEFLPLGYEIVGKTTKRAQLMSYLKANSTINLIDPYDQLIKLKKEKIIYYKTDTHWNRFGAFAVYQVIINRIREDFPELSPPYQISDYNIENKLDFEGDLVSLLDMKNTFSRNSFSLTLKEPNNNVVLNIGDVMELETSFLYYENTDQSKPRMLLYRDSFGEYLKPYLAEHFSYTGVVWGQQLNEKRILQEKPDILVQEIMERFIDKLLEL